MASGLDARQFAFIGFLPKITAKRKKLLQDMSRVPVTLIFYEAPHRIKETLDTLMKALGDRKAVKEAHSLPFGATWTKKTPEENTSFS